MKKVLAVVLLCFPVFGQAVYSGAGYSSGAAIVSVVSSGAPLTYSARVDNCITGAESGCVGGRTTGQNGSAISFLGATSDSVPFAQLSSGSASMNNCFADPDFGAYECFLTDQTTSAATTTWSMGSDGGYDAFNKDGTLLTVVNSGSVRYLFDAVPARFHAHTCAPSPSSSQCFVKSQIHGGTADATHFDNNAGLAFSRIPDDPPNTAYEHTPTKVYKLTITRPVDGNGTPTGLDTITRTLIVDYASDSPVPCSVLPADYVQTWNGGFSPSMGGSFTMAEGGGGAYQSLGAGAQTVTTDNFIRPVNSNPGGANGNWMFQASAGVTSGAEPNWAENCPAKGNTCSDGSATWTNIGNINGQGPGFDVVSYDPSTGCSRINTRLGKIYRGTGNSDPAGYMMTDDWLTCDRLANVSTPGTGTQPCRMLDIFGLHAASQQIDSNFATLGSTGGGGANPQFPGVGSCVDSGMKLNPGTGSGKWVAGTSYTYHDLVFGSDGNWYDKKSAGTSSATGDPTTDTTNWQNDNNLCYGYIWQKHTLLVRPLIGVTAPTGVSGGGFSTDGHNIGGYLYTYRGGKMFQHAYGKPTCDNASAPCLYEGAASPGAAMDATASCNDSHPTYRNVGTLDREPAFFPHADVPEWPTSYTCSTYNEETALAMDGSQTVWRFGHNYNTGSSAGFGTQNAIGVISQQGDMLSYSSDFMDSRGDRITGATTCANKLRGMYQPGPSRSVNYQDTAMPVTNNTGLDIYQAVGCPNNDGTTTCTEASDPPNWNIVCPSAGDYCTSDKTAAGTISDNNVLWLNLGPNTCRGDIVVMDVLSAHPAP